METTPTTPTMIQVGIPLHVCSDCGAPFARARWWDMLGDGQSGERSIAAQLARRGIKRGADHWWRTRDLCHDCEQKASSVFVCYLCKEQRPMTDIEQSFGDPPDCLCRTCYETVPAKRWDETVNRLSDEHRYDHT